MTPTVTYVVSLLLTTLVVISRASTFNNNGSSNLSTGYNDIIIGNDGDGGTSLHSGQNQTAGKISLPIHSNKNGDIGHKLPCEAGHPCAKDQWCSPSKRCRPCSDLKPWCHQTLTIHHNYSACEQYCYGYQLELTRTCETQKEMSEKTVNSLTRNLRYAELTLQNTTSLAEADRETCAREIRVLEQDRRDLNKTSQQQAAELSSLRGSLERTREDKTRCYKSKKRAEELTQWMMMLVALFVLLCLVTTGFAIKFKLELRQLHARRQGTGNNAPRKRARHKEQVDNRPLISTESKNPVQADRNSTHFDSDHDLYCIAGTGGRADAHIPGDSAVSP